MAFIVSRVEGHLDQRVPTVGIDALVGRPSAWARDSDHSVVNKAECAHASFWIINPTIRLLDDLLTPNVRELVEVLLPIAQVVADLGGEGVGWCGIWGKIRGGGGRCLDTRRCGDVGKDMWRWGEMLTR
jgi:hypothetical protein